MADFYGVATAAAPAHGQDGAVSDGHHGCSRGSGVIYAGVGTYGTMYGVHAVVREAGRDAGELERGLQEGFLHTFTFLVPIAVAPVSLVKIDGGKDGVIP